MMVQLNGIEYHLEDKLAMKLDLMIQRCIDTKLRKDALLIIEGGEGEGKSSSSIAVSGYIKSKTNRNINLFFNIEPMMRFAQNTEDQLIILDEPSLDMLSTDQLTTLVKNLMRLFMTVRKKRHFFIINVTKFWKFPEYIIVDRSLGMVHMYSRKEVEPGRFCYIKKRNLERLWNEYKTHKKRDYKKQSSFGGKFPEVMDKYFESFDVSINGKPHCTMRDYESQKNIAIASIGGVKSKMSKKELKLWKELNSLRVRLVRYCKFTTETKEKVAKNLGISSVRFREWTNIPLEDTNLLGKPGFDDFQRANNNIFMDLNKENFSAEPEEEDDSDFNDSDADMGD